MKTIIEIIVRKIVTIINELVTVVAKKILARTNAACICTSGHYADWLILQIN